MTTKNESAQPQLPPRPETIPAVYFGNDSIQVYGVSETDAYMNALEAENESLKAQLHKPRCIECVYCGWKTEPMTEDNNRWEEMREHITTCEKRFSASGYEMYKAAIASAKKAEAERDKALEVIREYRRLHLLHCVCPTCIKADELLKEKA